MKTSHSAAIALALGLALAPGLASPAHAAEPTIAVPTAFDAQGTDHDLFDAAVAHVIANKKNTKITAITDPAQKATVFVPTDDALKEFVGRVSGNAVATEQDAFDALLKTYNVYELDWALRYHVVPEQTLTSIDLVKTQGTPINTLLKNRAVTVRSLGGPCDLELVDGDDTQKNAKVVQRATGVENNKAVHVIDRVMYPEKF